MSVNEILENELNNADTTDVYNRQHLLSGYYNGKFGKWQLDINADAMWSNQDKYQQVNETATNADNRMFATDNRVDSRRVVARNFARRTIWKVRPKTVTARYSKQDEA